ncbi:DUF6412 domain-containing protein [Nonomuraea sp. NBC_01738]|uniref:DUF6412 domain-containing protein n=1 Tax=Nonomuraea sp. NBC_01738 TaxID=2976003 RepID=UPI002E132F94|nr:DUF6412 domain-containing protein [Nonomuraea sp. NBC_01738]
MTYLFDPALLVALATVASIGILLLATWAARLLPAREGDTPSFVLRDASGGTFVRQRDPDAAGRPRPRAPSVSPAFR